MRALHVLTAAAVAVAGIAPGSAIGAAAPVRYRPPVPGAVLRHYEPPPTPYAPGHRGIDLAAPAGSTVRAAAGGVVAFAGPVGGSIAVSIDHADGLRTTYSYLSAALVRAGAVVARGDPIARTGAGHPGSSLEPHLHLGVRRGETYLDVEALIVDSLRHDHAEVVRLAPVPG